MSSQESFSSEPLLPPPAKKKRISRRKKCLPKGSKTVDDDNDADLMANAEEAPASTVVVTPEPASEKLASNTKSRRAPKKKKPSEVTTPSPSSSDAEETSDEEGSQPKETSEGEGSQQKPKPKRKRRTKAADHQRITERDDLPKLWDPSSAPSTSYTFKIASFNVAGLRAFLRKCPDALADLVAHHKLDILCLQEIKLQESHVDDPKLKIGGYLLDEEGYDGYYSCSTAKKGYSGTAVFIKRRAIKGSKVQKKKSAQAKLDSFFATTKKGDDKKAMTNDDEEEKEEEKTTEDQGDPLPIDPSLLIPCEDIVMKMGKKEHDAEGRIITTHFPLFSLCNVYVPNSGQKLERLSYRTEKWDKDLLEYMKSIETKRGVPVIWLGDLNVAHTNLEVWNDGAKHLPKQAGVTAEERASFQAMLDDGPFVDAFRKLHPTAKGHYSYWSQRAGNREPNKGLRLDYFICSPSLFDDDQSNSRVLVRDSYMLPEVLGSDHCPVVLEMEIKKE